MNDKPISKGDLVMVVQGCDNHAPFGVPWTVGRIEHYSVRLCTYCGGEHSGQFACSTEPFGSERFTQAPVAWLKRLDPDNLMDDAPTGEELTV